MLNKICQLFLTEEVFAKMCHEIAHVRYIKNSNKSPRLSGHISIFGLVFVVLKSLHVI